MSILDRNPQFAERYEEEADKAQRAFLDAAQAASKRTTMQVMDEVVAAAKRRWEGVPMPEKRVRPPMTEADFDELLQRLWGGMR